MDILLGPGSLGDVEKSGTDALDLPRFASNQAFVKLQQQLRAVAPGVPAASLSHIKDFDELEKLYLQSVLGETGGSRIKAAERLGIHKATLFRKLRKLGINSEDDGATAET